MPLTPADVHNVVFSRPRLGRRGYSPEEVDTLLELVEDELSRHIEEESELRKLNATHLHREAALQRKAAELREFDARLRQWEADLRDEELELHQREAQLRQREADVNQKASELHRYEVARQQKVVALRQHEAKLRQLETALHQEAAELRQQGGAVVHQDAAIRPQEAAIHRQEAAITRQESQVRTNGAAVHQQIDHQQRTTAVGENGHIETFRTVAEIRGRHAMEWTAVRAVADLLGGSTTETKQELLRTTETEHSTNGVAAIESAQMKQLQAENAELNRVNGILKAAAALFAAEIKSPGLSVEDLVPRQDYA